MSTGHDDLPSEAKESRASPAGRCHGVPVPSPIRARHRLCSDASRAAHTGWHPAKGVLQSRRAVHATDEHHPVVTGTGALALSRFTVQFSRNDRSQPVGVRQRRPSQVFRLARQCHTAQCVVCTTYHSRWQMVSASSSALAFRSGTRLPCGGDSNIAKGKGLQESALGGALVHSCMRTVHTRGLTCVE